MAGIGTLISSLITSVAKLLPEVRNSVFAPSSSLPPHLTNASVVEDNLNELVRLLKRIKATLYDAEEREIRDTAVKLWLKELKEMAYEAEHVIDEYMYEVYRAQVEARNDSELNSHKRNKEETSGMASCALSIRIPDGFVDRIRYIRSRFDEIAKDREALRLHEEDGHRRNEGVRVRAPSSHLILESNVFGRESDKDKVIDLLFSNSNKGNMTAIPIIGKGGIGKTTLAQLVYNDRRVQQNFNLLGWICVSEDFNIERLMQELIESFTQSSCFLKNLSTLQENFKRIVTEKDVLVVLDDVWNEDKNLWELFCAPFMASLRTTFIVTTRNDQVAKVMQITITSPFWMSYLSDEESWSLFQHYAFGAVDHNVNPKLLKLGRQITKKCGGLPLALKAISNLLCYQNEESWVEILENDLWQIYGEKHIFSALQISYIHMPSYLKPCFLYCSLFPKDYIYKLDELVELWIAQGYIESKGRSLEEIAFEYAVELKERSFIDPVYEEGVSWNKFKIHDVVHDLAQMNSENELYSIGRGNPPDKVLHIYLDNSHEPWNHLYSNNIKRLKTLIVKFKSESNYVDLSIANRLRALKLENYTSRSFFKREFMWCHQSDMEQLSNLTASRDLNAATFLVDSVFPKHLRFLELAGSIAGSVTILLSSLYHLERLKLNLVNELIELEPLAGLVNLQYLSLSSCVIKRFPESLSLLCNLRTLCIKKCTTSASLEIIGNLIQLQKLEIHGYKGFLLPESLCKLSHLKTLSLTECPNIVKLPNDIGNLINLQNLIIWGTGINYFPPSFTKLNILSELNVQIYLRLDGGSDTISSLKDCDNLKGTLVIEYLPSMCSLDDSSWDGGSLDEKHMLRIRTETNNDSMKKTESTKDVVGEDMDLRVLENLRPHPNLKDMEISDYKSRKFPRWMGDPLCCASLEVLHINSCSQVLYLPFGNLGSLKRLELFQCDNIQTISRESLPSQLQSLIILCCSSLLTITGLEDLESFVELEIRDCEMLGSFPFELISKKRCRKSSSSGLKNRRSLKKLTIYECHELQIAVNEVVPSRHCNIGIYECEGLKEWCLQHNIVYTNDDDSTEMYSSYDYLGKKKWKLMKSSVLQKWKLMKRKFFFFSLRKMREKEVLQKWKLMKSDVLPRREDTLGKVPEEDISIDGELNNLGDSKGNKSYSGKQTMEMDEAGSSSSLGYIPAGQHISTHMEQGSSSADLMDEDHMEKDNSLTDVIDED